MTVDELAVVGRNVRNALFSLVCEGEGGTAGEGTNVSRVRYLSPFRYPGGKTALAPYIRRWLQSLNSDMVRQAEFIEPFAGGASIALMVAHERLANHVTMVEIDERVAAVWQTIFSDGWEWLANRILRFPLTNETVEAELRVRRRATKQRAFQTLLLNRVNHGGNMTKRARRLNKGEDGKGIRSRWYPEELSRRIRLIAAMRDRVTFVHGDGIQVIRDAEQHTAGLFFIDPPYTAGGKMTGARLYRHSNLDHESLFDLVATLGNRFLMTYDDSALIRKLAEAHQLQVHPIQLKNKRNELITELLIGRDLAWLVPLQDNEQAQQVGMEMSDE